jgi:hypothetical protein
MKACWKEDAQAVANEPQEETDIESSTGPIFFENCNIQPKNNIFLNSIQAKLTSVVSKWRQGIGEEF